MRIKTCILLLCYSFLYFGCFTRMNGLTDNDAVAVAAQQHEQVDSIFIELSSEVFDSPVDTLISVTIANKTKNSTVSLERGRRVEKNTNGRWVVCKHLSKTKEGYLFAATLLAVNIAPGGYWIMNQPLRSQCYVNEFTPGEYRLGVEVGINGKKRYVYSPFTVR